MDILTMIEKRANMWQEAKSFLEANTDKDGKISAENAATYDKMEKDITELGKNIERYERQKVIEAQMAKPLTQPILSSPNLNTAQKVGRASDEYKKAALTALRTNFKQVNNFMQEGTDSLGGYLVPTEWDERLIDTLAEENVMRKLGTIITTSGEHKINITGTKPAAAWVDEGKALTFSDTTFAQVTLDAHKLQVGVKVTNELLYDSIFDLETYIIEQFGKALSNAEEDAFLNGNGTGRPTGLFVAAAEDTSTVVTTSGTSIAADDIINLVYKLARPYRKNAVFILNDATMAAVRKLKDSNQAYLWQPSYQQREPDRLFGYPVYTSAYAPTIAAGAAVVAFGDMSYYNIADRGTRSFKELRELFMGNDMTGFVMIERIDGALVLPEAVKVLQMKG